MKDLIAALQIFLKYRNLEWPTMCEHDCLRIVGITLDEVLKEDAIMLDVLGFFYSTYDECWMSHRYGSA